jgi:hypothetical protein
MSEATDLLDLCSDALEDFDHIYETLDKIKVQVMRVIPEDDVSHEAGSILLTTLALLRIAKEERKTLHMLVSLGDQVYERVQAEHKPTLEVV